jgi:hypothetical protein
MLHALGFDDLRSYLQARCDIGNSVPRIATELGVSDWQVQAAPTRLPIRLAPTAAAGSTAAATRRGAHCRPCDRVGLHRGGRLPVIEVGAYWRIGWCDARAGASIGTRPSRRAPVEEVADGGDARLDGAFGEVAEAEDELLGADGVLVLTYEPARTEGRRSGSQ